MNRTFRTTLFMLFVYIFFFSLSLFWMPIFGQFNLSPVQEEVVLTLSVFFLPCIVYLIITQEPVRETLSLRPLRPSHIAASILIGIGVQPLMSLLGYLSSLLFPNLVAESMIELNEGTFLAGLLTSAILPAIAEETCFRGVIFSGFKNQSLPRACVMTGFLFSLMHSNLQQFLYTFAMGVLFAYMVYQTGSLFSAILAHFVFNGSQFALSYMSASLDVLSVRPELAAGLQEFISTIVYLSLYMVFMLPILVFGFWLLVRRGPARISPEQILAYHPSPGMRESLFTVPLVFILLLYFIFAIFPYILSFVMFLFSGALM